ncbi:alpha-(1-_3)-arabinofuranosyltransferase family protein [Corynebacterium liangguodongii]|uniref:DUF3367 domain-containing protein n=1 Tax=Corynebacterium liangguodongii TaxID=2079535 RepID=A0A2S0WGB2_9CORY|nr:alpha-(1->3)-arabinofuranosyltransferase family protein [Corynebacterium liangguodongii]AWB84828.1 DUF3367 domain-containing protein [Corynebacterium liangguodongii]PWB99185.1 DUF3367 domain-containing protein [Corynebacterium liangguodongii]
MSGLIRHPLAAHAIGWVLLTALAFAQPPGRVAADTKLNLTVDPGRFIAGATHAWTDQFTLGQLQNQAYGYLFPQGPFFLLPLPDWVLQRVWWALLLGLAFSGTLTLARRMGIPGLLPAVLYALSPRILTTLTAISSEAWPVALVPWTLVPLVGRRPQLAPALIPVALMGAVNAAATIAACVPAFILLLWRRRPAQAGVFFLGCLLVSAWWIGPLVVLGRYSPPFTDFIESAFVTTNWLNPAEILRGTTSWAPFVDTERTAGFLLVSEPVFVLATAVLAALGLAGLARRDMPWRGYVVTLFCLGFALLGTAHALAPLYDAPLAAFRNLHKFDPLVRLPLVLGVGWCASRLRRPAVVGVALVSAVALAPAWSLRLLPEGTWTEISPDWVAAGAWLDEHASGTRTLVVPESSFARQTWGWTRDEPIQAVSASRFAARDAIPLVDPEAIRGLDGQVSAVDWEALRSIGVGAVVVRRDLAAGPEVPDLGEPTARFGDVEIFLRDPARDMMITASEPVAVDGGGEVLPLLWERYGYFPARLVDSGAQIITDTPAAAVRNYGTLDSPLSAQLASPAEGSDVHNRVPDYPSAGSRVGVSMTGGEAAASSSAADATAFGGAKPSTSLTAAFDGLEDTAWWPAPGDDTAWLSSTVSGGSITITATDDTVVRVATGDGAREISLVGGEPRTVRAGGDHVRVELTQRVGIAELGTGVRRVVEVPGTADTYFFQRLFPATDVVQRRFTTASDGEWELSAPATIDGEPASGRVHLAAGPHEVLTDAETITISRAKPLTAAWEAFDGEVGPGEGERLILTARAFNEGLRASVGGVELASLRIDAGAQAFSVPPGVTGRFEMHFAGEAAYRWSLLLGSVISLLTVAACLWVPWRRTEYWAPSTGSTPLSPLLAALCVGLAPGAAAVALCWVVRRYTLIPACALSAGAAAFMGLWLARSPWPAAGYAGFSVLVTFAGCLAVAALACPSPQTRMPKNAGAHRKPGPSSGCPS